MSMDAARDLYRRFLLELWHAPAERLPALATEVVAPDFVRHRGGAPDQHGPAAIVTLIEQSTALFDDVAVTIDQGPVADGDLVAARWIFAGAYRGGIPGATAPVGTRVAFSGMDLVRLANGKVAEYWVSSDGDHLMAQLGVDGKAGS
ncbi:ester cyclase [Thermasporomyces composti]|jgi:predicted ester cyclase|nr:ester cyclase [Thermasporomyces composti]